MDDLDARLRDADRRIRHLDSRLDELEGEHQSLSSKFGYTEDLDYELRDIRSDISSCDDKVRELDDQVEELDGELRSRVNDTEQVTKRLTQQVRLLEGQIRAADGAPLADLDTFTKDQDSLARTMERGWKARSLLLSDHERFTFQARIRRRQETATKHQAVRATVIDTVGTLATSRYGSSTHTEATAKLRSAIAEEKRLRQDLARQAPEAEEAAEALAADAETRADKQPVLSAGVRAEKRLTLALRTRLSDAVSDRTVLPVWFVTVLGSAPPAKATQKWLETATQVLLYRLTYNITDQVLALGNKPSDIDRHRLDWHKQLLKDLRPW